MKCRVLIPFVDKHTKNVYAINETVDFKEERIKEIQNKDKNLIEVIKEKKEITEEISEIKEK